MTTRTTARSFTRNTLMLGTALGFSIAIAAAAAPGTAFALNECGVNVGGDPDAVCTPGGNPYPTGVTYVGVPGEDLTVVIEDDVVINTVGADVNGVSAYGAVGYDVEIVGDSEATVDATGDGMLTVGWYDSTITNGADVTAGIRGLFAYSYFGDAVVTNTGDIVADGNGTPAFTAGIVANSLFYDTTIVNTGDITVYSVTDAFNFGVLAAAGEDVSVTNSGAIDIDASAYGSGWGIYANGGNSATVTNTSDITVDAAAAGYAIQVITPGDAVVDQTGDIDVYAAAGDAYGVDVTAGGSADIDVDGNITVETGGAGFAIGVDVYAGDDLTVDVTGVITATSATGGAWGVFAYGDYDVTINVNDVYVDGAAGAGVQGVSAGFGYDVTINADIISTTGDTVEGVSAFALGGDANVTVNTISTTGAGAEGVYAYSYYDSNITVGSVTTTGDGADGVDAIAFFGDVNITSTTVDTSGDYAVGLSGYSVFGDVDIVSETVTTSGIGSTGIYAYSFFGGTSVDSGTVTTTGDGAGGIYAYGYYGATVTSDSVTTSGDAAIGIEARSNYGPVLVDSGTVTTSGDYSVGILAFGYGGTTVYSDSVSTAGFYAEGIVALDLLGPVVVDSGDVTTTGDFATGIRAGSYYDVSVTADTVSTEGASAIGINAYSLSGGGLGTGDVDVTFGSVTTSGDAYYAFTVPYAGGYFYYYGTPSHGIVADSAGGSVSVVGGDVTVSGDGASGIIASGFGSVYVNVDDVVTSGDANLYYDGPYYTVQYNYAVGIDASVFGGDVTVIADTVTTAGYGATGIIAVSAAYYDSYGNPTYYGDTSVTVNTVTTTGDYADGIQAVSSGGNVFVDAGSVTTSGDGADGIVAATQSYYDSYSASELLGDVNVVVDSVSTSGDNAFGIYALADGGNTYVDAGSVTTTGYGSVGVAAYAYMSYDSGQYLWHTGNVDVSVDSVSTSGDFATGIVAGNIGGNIYIDAGSVTTTGDYAGGIVAATGYYYDVYLFTSYGGNVNISADEVSTSGYQSDGIYAYAAAGYVNIYAGDVSASGLDSDAIVAVTGGFGAGPNDISIRTVGDVYSYDGIGISATATGQVEIEVDSGSVYGYDWGIQSTSVDGTFIYNAGVIGGGDGRAIDVDGGAADINNAGVIYGWVDLTTYADYMYNSGTWETYGTSYFGGGAGDLVVNTGEVGFGRNTGAPSNTVFSSLEYFDNYGVVSGVDDQAGDYLYMNGTAFFGGAGSELHLDVEFGGPGSIADVLFIGGASGVTEIVPNDALAASPGALNFGGILVVDSANAGEAGTEFVMDNFDKGFVEYELVFDAVNDDWLIIGLPDNEAFELLVAAEASSEFWRRSADAVTARWQEIRDASGAGGSMSAGPGDGYGRVDGWELWMQAHGGDEGFDSVQAFDIGGFTFVENLGHDSDWRGFQFGVDNLSGNFLYGFTMGFVQQETELEFSGNSFDFEGWNVGGYVGWASNGFFMNALLKADFYEVDGNFRTVPTFFSFDGTTWGLQGELGYRFGGASGWFLEPVAQLQWSSTDLDSFTTAGASVDFGDNDSLLGKAGARFGGTFGTGDVVLTPYVGVFAVEEFEGEHDMTFATGPTGFGIQNTPVDGYGQVEFGATAQTFYGLEGFLKGTWNFGDDADGGSARLGVRWRW